MRLGELLVKAGKITPAQLEEALKGQAIFGGRFGTNLVEMGFIDESDLAHFLSKQAARPAATPDQLLDIPPHIIKLIPEEYVRKYRVIPLALNNRKLTLAMVDPTDFAAIDEISFATGYIVVPVVAAELRMVTAMEKYYRIKREMRYISVEGGSRNRSQMKPLTPPHLAAVPATPPPQPQLATVAAPTTPPAPKQEWLAPEEAEILDLPMLDELDCLSDLSDLSELSNFGGHEPAPQPAPQPTPQPAPVQASPAQKEPEPDYSLETVVAGLAQAAKTAHEAATHEENIPDNKYDTLSLEASYVAQGQANRAREIRRALHAYQSLALQQFDEQSPILLTALVRLEAADGSTKTLFIGPQAGGLKLQLDGEEVMVITAASPLGSDLIGRCVGDEVRIGKTGYEIVDVC